MQIIDDKALVVRTTEPAKITESITKSVVIKQDADASEVAVHWTLDAAKALVRLGVPDVPSPIKTRYQWTGKHTPFEHQKETASFLTLRDKAFCFNEQGTGKTASVIWAADYLMKLGKIKRVLVICPLSIMNSAWQRDLFTFAMHRSCGVAHGSPKARVKTIQSGYEFVIINFDGLGVVEKEIVNGGFDLIVVDEANAYKNSQTNRWKILARILKLTDPKLWMLTGTPAAQSPLDAFGLARLVNPDNTPRYITEFRAATMFKATQFKWLPKNNADQTVHRVLQPAIRFEKKDCLDLPEVTYVERDAPLTTMQEAYYNLLKSQMSFDAAGESITAVNAAVNINKLLQISGGAVYSDAGEVIEFDVSNRMKVVIEAIEESSNKVLVFVPFTHTIELLKEALEKRNISCDVINGKVPAAKRGAIVNHFQTQPEPKVLLIQPQAASHGLTLTAADTVIWYAPVTSVETYLQANARINRPGQKNAMTVVHIKGSPVEARLYQMLQSNITNHEKIIELYRSIMANGA